MTRNLRIQLADAAERWMRAWAGNDLPRESAEVLYTYWDLADPHDDELRDLVLSRFAAAEPPSVPGRDWLPAIRGEHDFRKVWEFEPNTWRGACSCGFETLPCASEKQADDEVYTHLLSQTAPGDYKSAKQIVAEVVAKRPPWSAYGPCERCGVAAGEQCVFTRNFLGAAAGSPRQIAHNGRPLVEVQPGPTFIAGQVITADAQPVIDRARATRPGAVLTAAVLNEVRDEMAAEVQPDAEAVDRG